MSAAGALARRAPVERAVGSPVVLWLAAAALSGFTLRRDIGPLDEGILMQAASRMASGQWPWRDFSWAYGPGQPLFVLAANQLFGASLLWWRLLRVAADATCALLVWALVRDVRPRWALAAWAAAAVSAAQPVSANPASPALAFALGSVYLASRRPAWAGVAAAAAAFWRPDIGAAAALAAAVVAARGETGGRRGGVARVLVAAALATAALYLPFAIAAGPGRLWDALVVQATRDGAWWHLPFPNGYHGSDPLDLGRWLEPYAAIAIVVLAALRPRAPGLLVLAIGAIAYFLSRADQEHAQVLLIVACGLAATVEPRAAGAVALALFVAVGAGGRASALLRPPDLATLHLKGAGGVQVTPADARDLPRLAARVQRLDPPGAPIYVAPRRSDLVTFSDPLLHFLVRRPNVLHRDVLLQAKPQEQARIVAALRRARPRVIVRWTDPASAQPEPNRRGRPSGSRALDAYLARAYRLDSRFGSYDVLVPR